MTDTAISILQITDLHILSEPGQKMSGVDTEASFKGVLKKAHTEHGSFDLILVTGDLAQNPGQSSYQRIFNELEKYQTETLCLPGNHDDLMLMQQFINSKQVNCKKQRIFNHWQVICLNSKKAGSQGGYLATEELHYLTNTLQQNPSLYTLIAVHHHPIPSHSTWMDTMMIENNTALFKLLDKHPQVKIIVCGHIHQELQIQKNNQLILGTPSTCFQFKPLCTEYTVDENKPGYRILTLCPDCEIQSTVYRI